MLLELQHIGVNYGKVNAISDISITIPRGKVITIIGANGAGKTTTLRAMSGLVPIREGQIHFEGDRIDGLAADRIVAHGMAHVPEGRRVFPEMTVVENLRTGAFLRSDQVQVEADLQEVFARFPRMKERYNQQAHTLSGGEQQMLAIGRALMSRPKLLLMDEPSMGLAPVIVEEIAKIIKDINSKGISVVLVEQNAELALELADYAYVLETGRIALEGAAETLHDNDHVRTAYLGI